MTQIIHIHDFEYQGLSYCLVAMQGGTPLFWEEIEVPDDKMPLSQGVRYHYTETYAVNEAGQLILKKVHIPSASLTIHEIDVHQIIPLTGHILISNYNNLVGFKDWYAYLTGISNLPEALIEKPRYFEVAVVEGTVTQIRECTQDIETRLKALSMVEVNAYLAQEMTMQESDLAYWDLVNRVLPRPYDVLREPHWYIHYPTLDPLFYMHPSPGTT